ncbi:MAG: 50S ribosomal protein L17 [Deltaproteobacteria bacterium]|nr:50S ribosomal protein L17 [Deltaproteobacteria bacterium]
MIHGKAGKKFSRTKAHRKALFRNMATALLRHERIQTTEAKAKALRPWAEKLITLGKRGDLHARRLAAGRMHDAEVLDKLFAELGPRFKNRQGGYTRILKLGHRVGDQAPMAIIELVDTRATG